MKCPESFRRKRMKKGAGGSGKHRKGYSFGHYGKPNRGHTWKGHGQNRRCSKCGFNPNTGEYENG